MTKKLQIKTALLTVTVLLILLVGGSILLVFFAHKREKEPSVSTDAAEKRREVTFVIDAGHGGMDSGAVGVNGCYEKDLNLAVAEKLAALCRAAGYPTVMTRTEDKLVVEDSVTEHKKMHDLKNRLTIAEKEKEPLLVSIHMNTFSSARYSGLQVWYGKADPISKEAASYVQSYAKNCLDSNNDRVIKPGTSAIYLLDRAKIPAILIECGFLSNNAECEKLCTKDYQMKTAATIFAALTAYLSESRESS